MSTRGAVLVVEDDVALRESVCELLEESGHEALSAPNGAAALALLRGSTRQPAVILLDLMMPVMSGWQFREEQLRDPALAAIPVVVMSATRDLRSIRADEVLYKPMKLERLLAVVGRFVGQPNPAPRVPVEPVRVDEIWMQAPLPICILRGPRLVFEFANPLYCRIAGKHDLLGRSIYEAIPQIEAQGFDQLLLGVMKTGEPFVGKEMLLRLDRDGDGVLEDAFFTFIYAPIRGPGGELDRVMAVVHDVTDQVLARRAIERSEAKYRDMADGAPVMVWLTEPDGRCTYLNQSWFEFTGQDAVSALGFGWLDATHPEDRGRTEAAFLDANGRKEAFRLEYRLRRRDGVYCWAIDAAAPRFGPGGEFLGFVGSVIDISERREHELAVERAQSARLAELAQALRFSELFVGVLGHDLRNPLSAISAAAQVLGARTSGERFTAPVGRIVRSAARMERMISQLLDFTRIRFGGGLPLSCEPLDLGELSRAIIDELQPVHDHDLRLECEGDARGTGDADLLSQLLSNLVGNACQHGVARSPVLVRVDGRAADRLSVEVHSIGTIPAPLLPGLFDPLRHSKARGVERTGSSGLGLGLFISQQICHAHGGSIRADSAGGKTCFTVEIPRHARGAEPTLRLEGLAR
jgi:PAS domain S-box-containing protein